MEIFRYAKDFIVKSKEFFRWVGIHKARWIYVSIFLSFLLFSYFLRPSLTDTASVATVLALAFTMLSLDHSSRSLSETREQIEISNTKSVASVFLSKLGNIFENISYRHEQQLSESATGRAAIMEAFLTMDGGHNHYLSVDLLAGYFKFYLKYLEFLITNKNRLGSDYEVHITAVEQDFILFRNEIRSIVGNLKVLRSNSNQYYSIDEAQKSFENLLEFHRNYILGFK